MGDWHWNHFAEPKCVICGKHTINMLQSDLGGADCFICSNCVGNISDFARQEPK